MQEVYFTTEVDSKPTIVVNQFFSNYYSSLGLTTIFNTDQTCKLQFLFYPVSFLTIIDSSK